MSNLNSKNPNSPPTLSLNMPDDFELWSPNQKRAWFKQRESELRLPGMFPRYPKTPGDYRRVAEAVIWLLAVQVITVRIPQAWWARFLGPRGHATPDAPLADPQHLKAFRIQRAVSFSIQHLPGAGRRYDCLVRAVTSKWMLGLRGIPTTLYLGEQIIERDGICTLRKHAWLRCGDRVIAGWGPHVRHFTEVARFGSRR